jgi:alkylation response protein AidB-like acyl-CoA dehydrogenase
MDGAAPVSPVHAATLLAERFAATAADADRSGIFPAHNLPPLHQAGLLSLTVPRRFGGAQAGLETVSAVVHEIARGEPATALVLAMQLLQHAGIERDGRWPEAVHAAVAQSALRDGALINALRVEPELGTPARGGLPATVARRTADGWRIDGHKIFTTGVPVLRWFMVWARTEDSVRTGNFLVPADAPGIRVVRTWDSLGMRATESHDVLFQDVPIPPDYVVDVRESWPPPEPETALWNAVVIGALYQGVARAARDWFAGWLHARRPSNLGASLATLPRMQAELGAIDLLLSTSTRLWRGAAADMPPPATDSALLKVRLAADAIEIASRCLALTGNAGLSRRNPLERHFRDVHSARVHTPQADSALLAAGRAALGV